MSGLIRCLIASFILLGSAGVEGRGVRSPFLEREMTLLAREAPVSHRSLLSHPDAPWQVLCGARWESREEGSAFLSALSGVSVDPVFVVASRGPAPRVLAGWGSLDAPLFPSDPFGRPASPPPRFFSLPL